MQNERFHANRKRLGLTRTQLANALGMSRTTIQAYENDKHTVPRYVWLAMIALWDERLKALIREISEINEYNARP